MTTGPPQHIQETGQVTQTTCLPRAGGADNAAYCAQASPLASSTQDAMYNFCGFKSHLEATCHRHAAARDQACRDIADCMAGCCSGRPQAANATLAASALLDSVQFTGQAYSIELAGNASTSSTPEPLPAVEQQAQPASTCALNLTLWHRRLGHVNMDYVWQMAKENSVLGFRIDSDVLPDPICKPCISGKQHRPPIPHTAHHRASEALDLVHMDVHGPLPVQTQEGYCCLCNLSSLLYVLWQSCGLVAHLCMVWECLLMFWSGTVT
jgi:hypothetical protein